MQIVIDIPDEMYDWYDNGFPEEDDAEKLWQIVKNGTPLPKWHGRIADMDEALKCIRDVNGEDAVWAIALIEWACSKRTIIPADKEKEEWKR